MFNTKPLKKMYPEIKPFNSMLLKVSEIHSIYVEECGNPQGEPILFVHGGPGGSCNPQFRHYFNPEIYHIILFDQRGCGKSLPFGSIEENTTQDLIDDMEKIRKKLSLDQWILFGGSWGSTLSLLYAQQFPKNVSAMILRGIFLATERENQWFASGDGINRFFPKAWEEFKAFVPENEQKDLLTAYYKRLTDKNPEIHNLAAKKWVTWDATCSGTDPKVMEIIIKPEIALPYARIAAHFALNKYFISKNQVLDNMKIIENIPMQIIHSQHDFITPLESAYLLHKKSPQSSFKVLQNGGHAPLDPYIVDALVTATDEMAESLEKSEKQVMVKI